MTALLAALAILSQAASPQQFDLVCQETARSGRPAATEYRFRIDLEANRWCEGDCAEPRQIAAVTPDRYTLVDDDHRGRTLRVSNLSYVNRLTGEHWEQRMSTGTLTQISRREGRCERAEFSGMPQPRL